MWRVHVVLANAIVDGVVVFVRSRVANQPRARRVPPPVPRAGCRVSRVAPPLHDVGNQPSGAVSAGAFYMTSRECHSETQNRGIHSCSAVRMLLEVGGRWRHSKRQGCDCRRSASGLTAPVPGSAPWPTARVFCGSGALQETRHHLQQPLETVATAFVLDVSCLRFAGRQFAAGGGSALLAERSGRRPSAML